MAKTPKYSLDIWNQVKDHQMNLLRTTIPEVSNVRSQYVDDFCPYQLYLDHLNPKRRNYSIPGYEHIVFTLTCPAVVGFSNAAYPSKPGARRGNGKPTKITESDVTVETVHEMEIYFPRNYNDDPIGWGIRFTGTPPMYPNIFCAHHQQNKLVMNFSGVEHSLQGSEVGMVCIGAAASRTRPVGPAALIVDLIRSLKISDDNRYKSIGNGGVNDEGFEPPLFQHYVLNLQIIKSALSNPTKTKPISKKKKLGKTIPTKKKLGKSANER